MTVTQMINKHMSKCSTLLHQKYHSMIPSHICLNLCYQKEFNRYWEGLKEKEIYKYIFLVRM